MNGCYLGCIFFVGVPEVMALASAEPPGVYKGQLNLDPFFKMSDRGLSRTRCHGLRIFLPHIKLPTNSKYVGSLVSKVSTFGAMSKEESQAKSDGQ